jgi:hypothetical protein
MQSKVEQAGTKDSQKLRDDAAPENGLSLDWLKIIENATAGLTADLDAAKRERISYSMASEEPLKKEPARSGPMALAALIPEQSPPPAPETGESIVGKLTQIAHRLIEPRQGPPQSLQAAMMPYAVAGGLCVFILGGVLAFFAIGSSPADVEPATAAASSELLGAQPEQRGARKGDFQGQAAKTEPSLPLAFTASMTDPRESMEKPASAGSAQTWSETVETFREFVRTEVRKSGTKAGNAR